MLVDARGPPQGDRLRDRARRREPDDRGRLDHRHRAVPLARAGARRARRPELRHLLGRRRALRDAHRRGPVHRRHAARDRDEAPLGDPGPALALRAASPARPRPRSCCARSRRTRQPLPVGRGDGRRPGARRARARGRAETEEAATMVLAGAAGLDAPTTVTRARAAAAARRPAPPGRLLRLRRAAAPARRSGRGSSRRCSSPPPVVGGWFAYKRIQDQLEREQAGAGPERSSGSSEASRCGRSASAGLTPQVVPQAERGRRGRTSCIQQDPPAGNRIDKGNTVTMFVSKGKPKVAGARRARQELRPTRSQTLADAGLKREAVRRARSSQPQGTVIAQDPKPGTKRRRRARRARSTSRRA